MLAQDKARVRAIQSKLWEGQREAREGDGRSAAEAPLPARSGNILGSGDYFVRLGLGTPARELSLIFDTGSDLTWTQCLPCDGSCYTQNDTIFDPSHSSSYSNIPCSSSQCSQLSSARGIEQKCSADGCLYHTKYADGSSSTGNLANETLTITQTHVVDNFLFGCGHDNGGLFNGTAGLLGLGRNAISFVQQTSDMFHRIFSYCIPSTASEVGYLTFGGVPASDDIIYTPFSSIPQSSSFYALDLTGISLAGASLSIPSSVFSSVRVLIDSGTVLTWLPQAAYGPLRDAFRNAMSKYPMAGSFAELDTCYDLSGYETVVIPKVTLSFGGGVNVNLDASGVVYVVSETQVCLAFATNKRLVDIAILGNVQQKTIEVVYDVGGGRIGFRSASCGGNSRFSTGSANLNHSTGSANLNHPNLIWMPNRVLLAVRSEPMSRCN
ncbi:aspartyl protease family protein At5g10770-like [Neltuma alba]|uniref:aspartyl protease family protein At5g10770-like n=1 Tax=Neltuma alba TaxID=207710 RepID=UPI0010A437F0|nr:aspartyl protease family protein At5g10770-like [Prosopis alba]